MIVTKRKGMASLIHDTSPILRHSLQQSHNKDLYHGLVDKVIIRAYREALAADLELERTVGISLIHSCASLIR